MGCLAVLALPVNGGKGRSEPAVKMSCLQTSLGLTPPRSQLELRQPCTWPVNLFHLIAREKWSHLPAIGLGTVIPTSSQVVIETGDSISAFAQREARSGGGGGGSVE